tara:strand:- start:201 stop:467 length:267 start_codon:yes stop_codon:yes gene_type:complete
MKTKITEIDIIGHEYPCTIHQDLTDGYLHVMTLDDKFYWFIEGWTNVDKNLKDWEWKEITEELYNAIIKFYNSKKEINKRCIKKRCKK